MRPSRNLRISALATGKPISPTENNRMDNAGQNAARLNGFMRGTPFPLKVQSRCRAAQEAPFESILRILPGAHEQLPVRFARLASRLEKRPGKAECISADGYAYFTVASHKRGRLICVAS